MRTAILSDIHGNLTAFEAVLADLCETSPDRILHGGDLADMGANPVEIVDRIRDLGWPGVAGNGEEALFTPETLEEFASHSTAPPSLWSAVREFMSTTRSLLGEDRLTWLRNLPRIHLDSDFALVHASPESRWRAPGPEASDTELRSIYAPLSVPVVVYGHIHRPFIRSAAPELLVANSGSVGLSYDGDPRAAYLLLDDSQPRVRRVEYDIDQELRQLSASHLPDADWIARTIRSASPQMP
jgi:diadenosine tetraphosphatase ApaH/serine/threonine PP2A family protein phosphatase